MVESSATPIKTAYRAIKLRKQHPAKAKQIEKEFELSPVASRILAARGFKADQELKNFINPSLKEGLPDPSALKNVDLACQLISSTIAEQKPIAICCDFDVDGLSGGAQLHHFLLCCGAKSRVFVPDRFADGYGLNSRIVAEIAKAEHALLVCIDFGSKNHKELAEARALGLKSIVIDHHHVGNDLPDADVFINPQQQGCGFADKILCASGLVWYLLVSLRKRLGSAQNIDVRSYLDLACLGTICDMVPLIGANRVIAKRGLEKLSYTQRVGLQALKNIIGLHGQINCSHVSFGIGPRLNAAGRMVHGELVIELLTSNDSDATARIAKQLNRLNMERQDAENRIKELAIEQIKNSASLPHGIAVWGEDYHTGVIGIVAQRLVETFYRPSAVMGLDTDGVFKGSVRGIKGFNVVETLEAVSQCLIKYGGHEGAGGFSVQSQKLPEFAQAFDQECKLRLAQIETNPFAEADTEADLSEVEVQLVEELQNFAPFGMGNPGPLLLLRGLRVTEVKVLKGAHLKATLSDGRRYISGLMWRHKHHPALLTGQCVDVVFRPDCNKFNGLTEIQANLQAVQKAA